MVAGSTERIAAVVTTPARAPGHRRSTPSRASASAGGSRAPRRVLRRDGRVARARARAGDGLRLLLRRQRAINAFTVAIQIPNLVRALVADAALSGAFVPVFSELLERGERKRAWRVASTLFWLTLLILGGAHRALHPARAAPHEAVRRARGRLRPRGRALAGAVPDRRPPRPVGDRRRDPQHVPPLRVAGARADRVEPRDRPRPRPRGAADRRARTRSSTSMRASSSSGRSSSSCSRSPGCGGSTGA